MLECGSTAHLPTRTTPMSDDAVVVVTAVTHEHGNGRSATTVLHDVDLRVEAAESVALAGRSGSGKSTLCHLVAGVSRPTRGSVLVGRQPAHECHDWAQVALLPQRLAVVEEMTVRENAFLPCYAHGVAPDESLLSDLALAHIADRLVGQTSLGEQQRVGIARALAMNPLVAVLDEPTGHQDDEHVNLVLNVLREAGTRGTALLVATHDERILAVVNRVVRLSAGRTAQDA
jgi:putative ABC transport system ATP-binding protein